MSICPHCRKELVREQGARGLAWRCPACGGREVTLAVLRKTFAPEAVNGLWQKARGLGSGSGRRCPECGLNMREVPATDSPAAVRLEVCPTCTLVWFDAEEYETLPARPPDPPKPAEPELPEEAREALAMAQVKAIRERYDAESNTPDLDWWQWIAAAFGFPVEERGSECRRLPVGAWALAAVICLISILAFSAGEAVFQAFGLIPARMWRYGGFTLISSFFLHGDIMHLVGNMYFFLLFGDNVEEYLGWPRMLLLLLAATVVGDIVHIAAEPHSTVPCIGASGGISGVMAFYALAFPHARIAYLFRLYYRFFWVRLPALAMMGLWIALQLFTAWQQMQGFTNVSALAHLGGAAAGAVCWVLWRRPPGMDAEDPCPQQTATWGQR